MSTTKGNAWPRTPAMTRQHFNYLARVLRDAEATPDQVKLFAYHLADTNPRFDRERFVEAAS